MKRIAASLALVLLLLPISAPAGENPVWGTWKLQSFTPEVSAIGEGYNEFCETPDGYISYLPKGRMNAIIVTDNRAKPSSAVPTDDEKIKLFGTIIAYAALIPQIAIRSSTSRYLLESKLDRNRASAVLQARW